MKYLVKLQTYALAIMLVMTSVAYGQAIIATVAPIELPANTYVNGGDGDHQFIQVVDITLDVAAASGDLVTIALPTGITVADVDEDGNFDDEIYIMWTNAGGTGAYDPIALAASTPSDVNNVIIELNVADNVTAGDVLRVLFPVETDTAIADLTYTVSSNSTGSASGTTNEVDIVASASVASFDGVNLVDAGSGKVTTNVRGKRHPDDPAGGSELYTAATPDFLVETGAASNTANFVLANNLWLPTALDGTDDNGEIVYQLWASQTPDLSRVAAGSGQLATDASTSSPFTAVNENAQVTSAAVPLGALDVSILAEGDWYFYITSDATGEWVLGTSDTVDVRHHPSFVDLSVSPSLVAANGEGDGIDYDHDGIFEPTTDDNQTVTTLESGGAIGRDGTLVSVANPAFDSVNVHWLIEDVDDNARVHVFVSTNSGFTVSDVTTAGGVVTGLSTADEITTSAQFEEDADNFATWKTFTSTSVFEAAGDYTIYIVAYDGTNLGFKKISNVAGTALVVTVKHFPFFQFHDIHAAGGDGQNFDSATDRFLALSWGETIDGDKDVDAAGSAVIKLYVVEEGQPGLYDNVVSGNDPTLSASLTGLTTLGDLIATLQDSGDSRSDNRFMFDFRNSGLVEANYSFWAHISHSGDNLVVQYNSGSNPIVPGAAENDRTFALVHNSFMRAITPFAGPPVELDQGDKYRLSWEAFDLESAGGTDVPIVQAVAVLEGVSNPGTASRTTWASAPFSNTTTNDFIWILPTGAAGGAVPGVAAGAAAGLGSATITVSDYTFEADGTALPGTPNTIPEGNYDVYYFFDSDDDEDQSIATNPPNAVKAPGQLFITEQSTSPFNIELSPNRASMSPGDLLTVDVFASDDDPGQTVTNMAVFFVLIPQASLFAITDQDPGAPFQPFTNLEGTTTSSTLAGEVLLNRLETTADGEFLLSYVEKRTAGVVDIDPAEVLATFELEMTSAISEPLEDLEITFSNTDPFVTNLFDLDGSAQSTSLPAVALNLRLGQSGIISGAADVEGRDNSGQIVTFILSESGSLTPITNTAYLAANNDADGTDGVQVTLQGGGFYSLGGIPSGEYDLLIEKSGYLSEIRENVRVGSLDDVVINYTGSNKLLGGDAAGYVDENGDNGPNNRVDSEDIDAIADAFGTSPGDASFNIFADIDSSGSVDINDLFMASKNTGKDGAGIFYKGARTTNENAIVWLALVEETAAGATYAVRSKDLLSLSAYSVEMMISREEWELVGMSDGLKAYTRAAQATRMVGDNALFGSAVIGLNAVWNPESMDLMFITLRALAANAELPALSKVTIVSASGDISQALISGSDNGVPEAYSLSQNYPNPFNPTTTISFSLPVEGHVQLAVYNLLGQEIRTLVSGTINAGTYKAVWNSRDNSGRRVTSGLYFYRLIVDHQVMETHKMVLLK